MKLLNDIEAFLGRTGLTAAEFGQRVNNRQLVFRMRKGTPVGPGVERTVRHAMALIEAGKEQSSTVAANAVDAATRRASDMLAARTNALIDKMAAQNSIPFGDALVLAHMGPAALAIVRGAAA